MEATTKMITSQREMSELTRRTLEETLSGWWRSTLYEADEAVLYVTFGSEVDLDEYGRPIDPLRFSNFSKAWELLDGMNLSFDTGYAGRQLRWCRVSVAENQETSQVRYEARICQPKDASHVLIEYETPDSEKCFVPQNVIRSDDVKVFRQELRNTYRFWLLIPIGFRARVFDSLTDLDCLKDDDDKISPEHSKAFVGLAEKFNRVETYFLSQTEARTQIWREKAQTEYDAERKAIVRRRAELKEIVHAREQFLPKLERMRARLKAVDWSWARFLEKIKLYEEDMAEPRLVELPAEWKTSLQFYPDPNCEYAFSWLGKKYKYTAANVKLLEMYVIGIEAAEEDERHKLWAREKFVDLAQKFRVAYVIVDGGGNSIDTSSKDSYVFLRRRIDEMLLMLGPDKAEMVDWSTHKLLWTCQYCNPKQVSESKEDVPSGIDAMHELLEEECKKRPLLKRRLVCRKFVSAVRRMRKR